MDSHEDITIRFKKYLLILWVGVALGLIAVIVAVAFYDEITTNKFLGATLAILSLPLTISYVSLYIDIIKHFRLKLLGLMPLLFLPEVFAVVALLIPILYLGWLTYIARGKDGERP